MYYSTWLAFSVIVFVLCFFAVNSLLIVINNPQNFVKGLFHVGSVLHMFRLHKIENLQCLSATEKLDIVCKVFLTWHFPIYEHTVDKVMVCVHCGACVWRSMLLWHMHRYIEESFKRGQMEQLSVENRQKILDGLKKNWGQIHHEYQVRCSILHGGN